LYRNVRGSSALVLKKGVIIVLLKTDVEWHDLRMDAEDLPGEGEPVIVTIESISGERLVWHDVYFKYNDFREPCWCTAALNEYGWPEETVVWYPVIAWAYYPEPYYI